MDGEISPNKRVLALNKTGEARSRRKIDTKTLISLITEFVDPPETREPQPTMSTADLQKALGAIEKGAARTYGGVASQESATGDGEQASRRNGAETNRTHRKSRGRGDRRRCRRELRVVQTKDDDDTRHKLTRGAIASGEEGVDGSRRRTRLGTKGKHERRLKEKT